LTEVVWTRLALGQLQAIRAYVAQFHPHAAAELAAALLAAGNGLAQFPHRGRRVAGTAYRELTTRPPYIIRCRIAGETMVILRIRHAARRPTVP
jgi:plasmid stabilization system protein ParE